jgi:hypothetical protein
MRIIPLDSKQLYSNVTPREGFRYNTLAQLEWRNWQTRTIQGRVGKTVGVQLPPPAHLAQKFENSSLSTGRFPERPLTIKLK